ncbi:MAG: hypothetical protein M5R40_01365 [Anaerolineae bacterium]|nr:hypothetical protein [Anaerolineae bacterium]
MLPLTRSMSSCSPDQPPPGVVEVQHRVEFAVARVQRDLQRLAGVADEHPPVILARIYRTAHRLAGRDAALHAHAEEAVHLDLVERHGDGIGAGHRAGVALAPHREDDDERQADHHNHADHANRSHGEVAAAARLAGAGCAWAHRRRGRLRGDPGDARRVECRVRRLFERAPGASAGAAAGGADAGAASRGKRALIWSSSRRAFS